VIAEPRSLNLDTSDNNHPTAQFNLSQPIEDNNFNSLVEEIKGMQMENENLKQAINDL
jgi:hypothetical protein